MLKKRRGWRWGSLLRAVKPLSARSLVAALEAASVSPTECHRISALMSVFASVVNNKDPGHKPVHPEDYTQLMAMSEQQGERLDVYDAQSPYPTQPAVLVGWGGSTFRFLPSATHRAATQIEVLERLCSVLDPVLVDALGYGLGDVVELTLRRIDHVVSTAATAWGGEPQTGVLISTGEIEAAASLSCLSVQAEECFYPDRAKLALEEFTAPPEVLSDLSNLWEISGPAISVWAHTDTADGRVPLPAGSLMKPLRDIAELLAGKATTINPNISAALDFELGKVVFEEMRQAGHSMRGVVSVGSEIAYLVAEYEDHHGVILVDVVAALGHRNPAERMERGVEGMYALAVGADYQSTFDTTDLSGMDVLCIQVVSNNDRPVAGARAGCEVVDISAFLELLRSLDTPDDLCTVLKDKAELDAMRKDPELVKLAELGDTRFGQDLSLLEVWKIWKDHGKRLSLFSLHFAEALADPGVPGEELAGIPEFSPLEQLLAKYGQPELSTWPNVFIEEGLAILTDPSTGMYTFVLAGATPVMVNATRSLVETTPEGYTQELGLWIFIRLIVVKEAFLSAALDCNLESLYVKVVKDVATQPAPLRVVERDEAAVVIGWNDECVSARSNDPAFVDMTIGHCLAECFDSASANTTFFQAWQKTNPFIKGAAP